MMNQDNLIVALKWQNQTHIILSNEFDLKLFETLMGFEVLNKSEVPKNSSVWTFAEPKGGLSWFKWSKADLSKGIDRDVFNYVASGDIEALPRLNYNELYLIVNGGAGTQHRKGEVNNGISIGGINYK